MRPTSSSLRAVSVSLTLLSFAAACSKDAAGSAPGAEGNRSGGAAQQGGPAAGGSAGGGAAAGGGAGATGGGARGPGGRPSPSITLAATDVATVAPMTIEDGVALTGEIGRASCRKECRSRVWPHH